MTAKRFVHLSILVLVCGVGLSACQPFRNFTTYYNLFYNMERIMDEVEDELQYMRELKTPEAVYYVPHDDALLQGVRVYNHLDRRTMNVEEMRGNKVKLDSILIKGSKLLARSANSDYVDDAVFYIGKGYYYLREWYQSQKKTEELIANFPDSKWLPDAHLFLAMAMLQQGNVAGAKTNISQAMDIGWAHKRRDVLIEAFRLNADVYLAEGDLEKALEPYQRAMLLSSDDEESARWQHETGLVYFRSGKFQEALREFDKVEEYSPDVLTQFQNGLQRAVTLRVLGQTEPAGEQLADLASNNNFEPWWGLVALERINLNMASDGAPPADDVFVELDSTYPGKGYAAYGIYERAVRAFRAGDYQNAYMSFQKVMASPLPFQRKAQRYAVNLAYYFDQKRTVDNLTQIPLNPFPDSTKAQVSDAYYALARIFVAFDLPDSTQHYYGLADQWAPVGSVQAARSIYARSVIAREEGKSLVADSLLEVLVQDYSLTDYAADARVRLNYTEYAKIDTAEELYISGKSHMRVGETVQALERFNRVVDEHPQSSYAPRALYAIGLLYEEQLDNRDSAFAYYTRLMNSYPRSEHAVEVKPLIDAVIAARVRGQSGGGQINPPNNIGERQDLMQPDLLPDGGNSGTNENLLPLDGGQQPNGVRMIPQSGTNANDLIPVSDQPTVDAPTVDPATQSTTGGQPANGGSTAPPVITPGAEKKKKR